MTNRAPDPDYDVIVLGGGFAGVTAARDCRKNGYRTLLLEARDRLGGRTCTAGFAGHKVELGGTWIHWTQPFVWAEVQRYGLEVVETPAESAALPALSTVVLVDGHRERLETHRQVGEVFGALARYFADAPRLWERPYDAAYRWQEIAKRDALSVADVLPTMDLTPIQRVVLEAYLAGLAHCPAAEASHVEVNRWWALPGGNLTALSDSAGRYRFRHGTASLIEQMVADGKPEIRLSAPVSRVEDRGDHVVVTLASGQQIRGASVIVALPMNVLGDIAFAPALDAQVVAAARERHSGAGIKVLIKASGSMVGKRVNAIAAPPHPLPLVSTYETGDDYALLVSFAPDPGRIDYSDRSAVQQALRDFFPDAVVEDVLFHPWTDDPYSQGTWANYRPGWFGKYVGHFQQDRGRVFFGQGDHGEGWRGFIDGAIGAGAGAAERVRKRLGALHSTQSINVQKEPCR